MRILHSNVLAIDPEQVRNQYCSDRAVDRYDSYFQATARHRRKDRREKRCVLRALSALPADATVLDLPCGTGRMYPLLKSRGFHVVSADSSAHMVARARENAQGRTDTTGDTFVVADIFQTPFADDQFDAVLSNRLFHHFADDDWRRRALAELSRICTGPIVVSFFSTVSATAIKIAWRRHIARRPMSDRIPIAPWTFAADAAAAGLQIERWLPSWSLLSMQWYVVLRRNDTPPEAQKA